MGQLQRQAGPSAPPLLADAQIRRSEDEYIVPIPPSPVKSNMSNMEAHKGGQSAIEEEELEPDEAGGAGGDDGHAQDKEEASDRCSWLTIWKKCPKYLAYMLPLGLCLLVPILVGLFAAPDATIGASDNTRGVRIVWFFTWVSWAFFSLAPWFVISGEGGRLIHLWAVAGGCLVFPLGFKAICQSASHHISNYHWIFRRGSEEVRRSGSGPGDPDIARVLGNCLPRFIPSSKPPLPLSCILSPSWESADNSVTVDDSKPRPKETRGHSNPGMAAPHKPRPHLLLGLRDHLPG